MFSMEWITNFAENAFSEWRFPDYAQLCAGVSSYFSEGIMEWRIALPDVTRAAFEIDQINI